MRPNTAPRSRPPWATYLTRLDSDAVVRARLRSEARATVPRLALPAHQLSIARSAYFWSLEMAEVSDVPSVKSTRACQQVPAARLLKSAL